MLYAETTSSLIEIVHLYDAQGNKLLFTTYQYSGEKNVSRMVYHPGGGLFRKVYFENAEGGATEENRLIKEKYEDANGNLQNYSTFSIANSVKTQNLFDGFDQPLLSSNYNTTPSGDDLNEYKVNNKEGNLIDRMVYTYRQSGVVDKVNIYDEEGKITHVAVATYPGETTLQPNTRAKSSLFYSIKRNSKIITLGVNAKKKGTLIIDVYNIKGSFMGNLKEEPLTEGKQEVSFGLNSLKYKNGLYLLRVYLKGTVYFIHIKAII